MKVGDGTTTWEMLPYSGMQTSEVQALINDAEDNFSEIVPNEGETDAQAIARVISTPKKGDIAAVKRNVGDSHTSYTGYVYNGTNWGAMDGNYNAENVYFNDDLTYTKSIGELPAVPSSGSATLSAKDKNVKEVLASILAKKAQPSVTEPSVSISGAQSNEDLEIGSNVSKSGTLKGTFNAGSYTYGPSPTGATVSS